MNDCLTVFKEGLKHLPHDSFLQAGVALLTISGAETAPLVKEFHALCQSEIQRHLGPQAKLPYSTQKGWMHNVRTAKSIVAWVINGRANTPQRISRLQGGKIQVPSPTTTKMSFDPASVDSSINNNSTTSNQYDYSSSADSLGVAESRILNATWRIFEYMAGIPRGEGPKYLDALEQRQQRERNQQSLAPPKSVYGNIPFLNQHASPTPTTPSTHHHYDYYESQLTMGRQLFEALKEVPAYHQCDGMDFRIILPAKTSLARQTKERLTNLLWGPVLARSSTVSPVEKDILRGLVQRTRASGLSMLDKTARFDPTNSAWRHLDALQCELNSKVISCRMFPKGEIASHQKYIDLCQTVYAVNPLTGKRRLVLIIADEAHHAIGRNGMIDQLLHGARHRNGKWPNSRNPLCAPNVFIFCVSATGWNQTVAPYRKVITWNDLPSDYVGMNTYLQSCSAPPTPGNQRCDAAVRIPVEGDDRKCTLVCNTLDQRIAYFKTMSNWTDPEIQKLLPSIVLMADYALAFLVAAGFKPSTPPSAETLRIVNHLNSGGNSIKQEQRTDIVLIRVQRNGIQTVFAHWLKLFRSILSLRSLKIVCPSDRAISSEIPLKNFSFETSLQGHRVVCIVVETARMGDTIPGLSFFDLRARYQNADQSSFSSFLQDIGRCFGYNRSPPILVLNVQGHRLLTGRTSYLDHYLQRTKLPLQQLSNLSSPNLTLKPSLQSMWTRVAESNDRIVLDHAMTNRFLLLAQPQCGKTAAYIRLIEHVLLDKGSCP